MIFSKEFCSDQTTWTLFGMALAEGVCNKFIWDSAFLRKSLSISEIRTRASFWGISLKCSPTYSPNFWNDVFGVEAAVSLFVNAWHVLENSSEGSGVWRFLFIGRWVKESLPEDPKSWKSSIEFYNAKINFFITMRIHAVT